MVKCELCRSIINKQGKVVLGFVAICSSCLSKLTGKTNNVNVKPSNN